MRRTRWLTHLLLIVACFVVMLPVLFALIKATQPNAQVLSPSLVPGGSIRSALLAEAASSVVGVVEPSVMSRPKLSRR